MASLEASSSSGAGVTLGARCLVHESAVIDARRGPIVIDDDTCVDEGVVIANESEEVLRIGRGNWFQVKSVCRARAVGDYNVFKPRSVVEAPAVVGSGCSVGAGVRVVGGAVGDGASVFRRGDAADARTCDHLLALHKVLAEARAAAIPR